MMTADENKTVAQAESALSRSALQAAAPIVLALQECEKELQEVALRLFEQLLGNELDKEQCIATTTLLAEILFPNADGRGIPGLDLEEAEAIVRKIKPEAAAILDRMNEEETQFADRLRQAMEEQNITQAELAKKLGIGQPAISMMLRRDCRPQMKTVVRFAEALGVSPEQLWPGLRG